LSAFGQVDELLPLQFLSPAGNHLTNIIELHKDGRAHNHVKNRVHREVI